MTKDKADENCMTKWGRCIYGTHLKIYQSVSGICYNNFNILYNNQRQVLSHERNDIFHCWDQQCPQPE